MAVQTAIVHLDDPMNKKVEVRSQLRLPANLQRAINNEAYKARHAINVEIVQRLERSFEHEEKQTAGKPRVDSINPAWTVADLADLRDSIALLAKQLRSERALIRTLALAVVTSADLALQNDHDEISKSAADAVASLGKFASRFMDCGDDGDTRSTIDDWHAK